MADDWKIHHLLIPVQGDVGCVCMLNDWVAATTKFALTIISIPCSG